MGVRSLYLIAVLPLLAFNAPSFAADIVSESKSQATISAAHHSESNIIVATARARTLLDIRYDPKYVRLDYPGGDVDPSTGVCTDVIIRTFRDAMRFDFQKAVHEDMKANFSQYPKIWGLKRADKNIDHRRVPNLETFLKRQGTSLPVTKNPEDYLPGDIVTWRLGGRLPHMAIISDKKSPWGTPLVIHNVGQGVVEDDLLFNTDIEGHFRFKPNPNMRTQTAAVSGVR